MLEKDNIRLRAVEPEDVDFILEMENDTSLWHVSNTYNPFSRFDIEQYVMLADKDIYSAKQVRYIIEDTKVNENLGMIDVFDFDAHNRRAGVGILIIESKREKGVASKALEILKGYLFNHIGLHQIYCNINSNNPESVVLFENHGFKRTGLKTDWNLINNQWIDVGIFQLINSNQQNQ